MQIQTRNQTETQTTNPNATPPAEAPETARTLTPAVDIYENDHALLVLADLPGVSHDGVEVHLDPERLTFEATRVGTDGPTVYRRAFTVAPIFDVEKVTARLERGVLHLTLPKLSAVKPRQIPVTGA